MEAAAPLMPDYGTIQQLFIGFVMFLRPRTAAKLFLDAVIDALD